MTSILVIKRSLAQKKLGDKFSGFVVGNAFEKGLIHLWFSYCHSALVSFAVTCG